jgi:hypothetical protein
VTTSGEVGGGVSSECTDDQSDALNDVLIIWNEGRPIFTGAGVRHYEKACAEVGLSFVPAAVKTRRDFRALLKSVLLANQTLRKQQAQQQSSAEPCCCDGKCLELLARRAIDEVLTGALHQGHWQPTPQRAVEEESESDGALAF